MPFVLAVIFLDHTTQESAITSSPTPIETLAVTQTPTLTPTPSSTPKPTPLSSPISSLTPLPALTLKTITKVIDGDTVVIEGGDHVRLLGIDADEPGYPCYYEAKNRLESLALNKKVAIEKDKTDKDQYNRLLRYLFLDTENINLQLVKEGLAICRFYEPDIRHKEECAALEKEAEESKIGCKWKSTTTPTPTPTPILTSIPTPTPTPIPTSACKELTQEKTGLQVIQAKDAENHYGEEKIVEGYVASTRKYSNPALFINFCKPYPNHCFSSIIWSSNWYKFPQDAATLYYNKTVRVRGDIAEYEGKPEIILYDPSQIEVCQ